MLFKIPQCRDIFKMIIFIFFTSIYKTDKYIKIYKNNDNLLHTIFKFNARIRIIIIFNTLKCYVFPI